MRGRLHPPFTLGHNTAISPLTPTNDATTPPPHTGECVPLRLFLSGIDLTPTYRSVNNRFSVRYYINLVLVDEEDRRYFKQSEIIFWRRDLG